MTIIFSRATAQLIQKQELPADAVEVSLESAKIIQSALVQGLPFELLADGTVTVAPTPQHKYDKDKDRWIDYAYQYSASTGACYPSDMLDQYADKPADLQPITADVYAEIVAARSKGLSFVVKSDGESVNVAPSVAHVWDAKKGDWLLDKAKQAELDAQAEKQAAEAALVNIKQALQAHIDGVAHSLGFTDGNSVMLYAGFNNPFRALAEAFGAWEAGIWVLANEHMALVKAGKKAMPTLTEAVGMIPAFVPPSAN